MSEQIQESWPIPETMVDGITGRLRRAIITGTIRPGERIRVAELERKFGVSHIPDPRSASTATIGRLRRDFTAANYYCSWRGLSGPREHL